MRSRLSPSHVSFVAWAVATGLTFAACANGTTVSGTANGGAGASQEDSGASTQQVSEDAGTGSNVGNPNGGGDDAGGPVSDDAGGASKSGGDAAGPVGNDAGSPTSDDAGSGQGTGGDDAGTSTPPSSSVCPDTKTYQEEYVIASLIGGTSCTTTADCSSGNCCYAGTETTVLGGSPLCVLQ